MEIFKDLNINIMASFNQHPLPSRSPPAAKRRKSSANVSRKELERFAITFSEATVHAGGVDGDITGEMAPCGFSVQELQGIAAAVNASGGRADYVRMSVDDVPVALWPPKTAWKSSQGGHEGDRFMKHLEAGVLILRGGADYLCGPGTADRLFREECSYGFDRLYYNPRQHKIMKKNARYNIEYGPVGKEQSFPSIIDPQTGAPLIKPEMESDKEAYEAKMAHYQEVVTAHNYVDPMTNQPIKIPSKKKVTEYAAWVEKYGSEENVKYFKTIKGGDVTSTVKAFADLPVLDSIRKALPGVLGYKAENLFAEGNHYYGPASNINYHGDGERKKVICLCLGRTTVLKYQWRAPIPNNAVQQIPAATLHCHHGDIYIMSEKATGYDWKFGRNMWPEPRLVHGAAFDEAILQKFMDKKSAKQNKK